MVGVRNFFNRIKSPLCLAISHSYLLRGIIARQIRGRFAGSMAGTLWALINPLAQMVIYIFIFSLVLRIQVSAEETGTDRFAVFFLTGFFPWIMFADGLARSTGVLVENANLITKVVFPVELLPLGTVLSVFIVNGLGLFCFLCYLLTQNALHVTWLFLLVLLPIQVLFTLGLACLLSAVCVFLRDISELLSIVLTVWFYATPIIYPFSMVPESFEWIMRLNPMSLFIGLYRDALLLHRFDWTAAMQVGAVALAAYVIGTWFFIKAKPAFGDVL